MLDRITRSLNLPIRKINRITLDKIPYTANPHKLDRKFLPEGSPLESHADILTLDGNAPSTSRESRDASRYISSREPSANRGRDGDERRGTRVILGIGGMARVASPGQAGWVKNL